jgi:hypothetical protein
MRKIIIAPSILSADFSNLKLDIEKVEKGIYTKEEVAADQYNFQNLQSAKIAFSFFDIDLHRALHNKILRKSRPRIDLFQSVS